MNKLPIIKPDQPAFSDAVLIDNRNMEPTIRLGSIVFIEPPGGHFYDGICAFDNGYSEEPSIRRVQFMGNTVSLGLDGWPAHSRWQECDREAFMACSPRMVAGVALPYTTEFRDFLRSRFLQEGGS